MLMETESKTPTIPLFFSKIKHLNDGSKKPYRILLHSEDKSMAIPISISESAYTIISQNPFLHEHSFIMNMLKALRISVKEIIILSLGEDGIETDIVLGGENMTNDFPLPINFTEALSFIVNAQCKVSINQHIVSRIQSIAERVAELAQKEDDITRLQQLYEDKDMAIETEKYEEVAGLQKRIDYLEKSLNVNEEQ